jgi:hypothetical protein
MAQPKDRDLVCIHFVLKFGLQAHHFAFEVHQFAFEA